MTSLFVCIGRQAALGASVALGALATGAAWAQPAPDAAPAFDALNRWAVAAKTPPLQPPTGIETLNLVAKGGFVAAPYEPQAVILGAPDLPLLGEGAQQPPRLWNPGFNYHGLQAQLLLWDGKRRALSAVPLSTPLKRGQPFRLRLMATFEGVAVLEQVLGPQWRSQRAGQVYPQPGLSVAFKAGEVVDLPIEPRQFMVLPAQAGPARLLLAARHARAAAEARSQQPLYRQDKADASAYLQLVPRGQFPAFEQLVGVAR